MSAYYSETLAQLRARANDLGIEPLPPDRISLQDTCRLLDMAESTFRAIRSDGRGPRPAGLGARRSRVMFEMIDLAIWLCEAEPIDRKAPATASERREAICPQCGHHFVQ